MKIDINRITDELSNLSDIMKKENQIMLQTTSKLSNKDMFFGVGSFKEYRDMGLKESDFDSPLFDDMPYINSILHELKMYRSRILILKPKSCYSYHVDASPRIHIPIITTPNNFMVIEDKCYWMPANGSAYYTDTERMHTFVNADLKVTRIHIVGCIDRDPKNNEIFYVI